MREAVVLQGFEEARHANLLRLMVRRYGLATEERPLEELGLDLYRAFADFGYGECLDAFLGFGVFNIARRSAFLPDPMFAIFDTLMHEENRHIVLLPSDRAAPWHCPPRAGGERRQRFLGNTG